MQYFLLSFLIYCCTAFILRSPVELFTNSYQNTPPSNVVLSSSPSALCSFFSCLPFSHSPCRKHRDASFDQTNASLVPFSNVPRPYFRRPSSPIDLLVSPSPILLVTNIVTKPSINNASLVPNSLLVSHSPILLVTNIVRKPSLNNASLVPISNVPRPHFNTSQLPAFSAPYQKLLATHAGLAQSDGVSIHWHLPSLSPVLQWQRQILY